MYNFKNILFIMVITIFRLSAVLSSESGIDCNKLRKCSLTEENTVWAVDEKNCLLFRNTCIFEHEVCKRKSKNEEKLTIVTRAKCKEQCLENCTKEFMPVCAEYKKVLQTFSYICELRRESCQNDKSYYFVSEGKCSGQTVQY